ncbi:amidohydrolase [Flavobacterium sp. HJ-32-4]|uniref:amidohydrolase n=2 Tax=unclassified Flavobacterium TaxID=196869 RepID=UPI001F133887|nr:amidohydrolase [Flavobacterium sp. HJ-32-4]UMY66209.1 amidohydrolase [Flavobacterium sp. HJ-32-4]
MKIALVQTDLAWEQPFENREQLTKVLQSITADLIVLPEMFTTGFTMHPAAVAETMDGPTLSWMKEMAAERPAAVTGSVVMEEAGSFRNRLLFVYPSGDVRYYDKRHLFTLAGEDVAYAAGQDRLVLDYKGIRICPLICYDLRFPVFSRNTESFDLLLYVANWPAPRIEAWDALLKARAIENVCYVAGVNRVGHDANGHHYPGHTQAFDFAGRDLLASTGEEGVFVFELDTQKMQAFRERFAFLQDRDDFTLLP